MRRLLAGARLLTLTGLGGVGKSRLVLRAARQCERVFRDGVWLVELAGLTDAALVPAAAARGLGLPDEPPAHLEEAFHDHVGRRRLLLVLDNCEHLLAACARLVGRLLRECPNAVVFTTSREPLGVEGEVVYPVPPLGLPEPNGRRAGDPARAEAVTLFVERARASLPGFQLTPENQEAVFRLCRALDGIPLAIEMAAVRLRALSLDQIVERLQGRLDLPGAPGRAPAGARPARHHTLRATMDWSHELLSEPERVLWRRLSVFAGGCTLEAAERVCAGPGLERHAVVGALVGLVDRSLVGRVEGAGRARYRLLETVRQYGRDRLSEVGEEASFLASHREWCAVLAREAAAGWWGDGQAEALARLEAEHGNLRAALAGCLAGDGEASVSGLAICADTWFYWHAQRHLSEGRRWLADLLPRVPEPTPLRARALSTLGMFLLLLLDPAGAQAALEEAAALARRLGEQATEGLALSRLGLVAAVRADPERALALTDEGLRLGRLAGDQAVLATALSQAGRVAIGRGDLRRAIEAYGECVDLCRSAGERWLQQRALLPLAAALADLGDHDGARRVARTALAMASGLDDERMMVWAVEALAWTEATAGQAEQAARLLGAVAALRGPEPAAVFAMDRARTERCRSAAVAALGEDGFRRCWERGAALNRAAALALALDRPASEPDAAPAARPPDLPLSAREREIAMLVAQGMSNRAIADRLFISVRTAENHVSHILVKLGLRSRAQLASFVMQGGAGPPFRNSPSF